MIRKRLPAFGINVGIRLVKINKKGRDSVNYAHVSVLLREAVEALVPRRGGFFVDCTAGGGGHSEEILRQTPHGARLISLDQDERAVVRCRQRLAAYGTASTVVKANFAAVGEVLDV